jgi:hypothetical protein
MQKTHQQNVHNVNQPAASGQNGIAVMPPAYEWEDPAQYSFDSNMPVLLRAAIDQSPVNEVPSIVHEVLRSPGQPLDDATRAYMEPRLGHDFSAVRVHTDAKAAESAQVVNALAYTVGRDVVFGAGRYAPQTSSGQRLTAHELTHVVQQSQATQSEPLRVGEINDPAEIEATDSSQRLGANQPIKTIHSGHSQSLQREVDEQQVGTDSLGVVGDTVVDTIARLVAGEGLTKTLLAAAVKGFIIELRVQAKKQNKAIAARLEELTTLRNGLKMFGGFLGGATAGLISPLTGLFDLAVLGEKMRALIFQLGMSLRTRGGELVELAIGIKDELVTFGKNAAAAVRDLIKDLSFKDILEAIAGMSGKNNILVRKANELGHDAAQKVVTSFVESPASKPEESWKDIFTKRGEGETYAQPLSLASSIIERSKEKVFHSFSAKVGYDIGYALGFVAINIIMFAFTGGIGNLITEIGTWLGKIAPALTRLAEAIKVIGPAIAAVEEAMAVVMQGILKPLQPLLKKLEPVLLRLRTFLRKLFGVVEKEAGQAASTAGKVVAGELNAPKPKLPPSPTKPASVESELRPITTSRDVDVGRGPKPKIEARPVQGADETKLPSKPATSTMQVPTKEATTGDTSLDKEIDDAFDRLAAGRGGGDGPTTFDPNRDPYAGPGVRVRANKAGEPAKVLDVGAGAKPTNLGLPPETNLVAIERSDLQAGAHIQHQFDATKAPPMELIGKMDAVMINNPRGYTPNIEELGRTLKPGGRIIVQGRGRVGPASPKNLRGFNPDFQKLLDDPPPAGYRKIIDLAEGALPPAAGRTSADVLGGPFFTTEGDQRIWPNARVIFERIVG